MVGSSADAVGFGHDAWIVGPGLSYLPYQPAEEECLNLHLVWFGINNDVRLGSSTHIINADSGSKFAQDQALISDIELYEAYPSQYGADTSRRHRHRVAR